ncbi:hypothetical protein M5689_001757 [Euphorbia peplus]|nr:hypothetical protein M5689_001757 [Euphorbia peplus]
MDAETFQKARSRLQNFPVRFRGSGADWPSLELNPLRSSIMETMEYLTNNRRLLYRHLENTVFLSFLDLCISLSEEQL